MHTLDLTVPTKTPFQDGHGAEHFVARLSPGEALRTVQHFGKNILAAYRRQIVEKDRALTPGNLRHYSGGDAIRPESLDPMRIPMRRSHCLPTGRIDGIDI